jgi:hypothetical protein
VIDGDTRNEEARSDGRVQRREYVSGHRELSAPCWRDELAGGQLAKALSRKIQLNPLARSAGLRACPAGRWRQGRRL